jgi:hypothetical protein
MQCFGSGFIGSGCGSSILGGILIRIQGFDDQKFKKKNLAGKIFYIYFLIKNCYLCPSYLQEKPSERTSSTSKHEIS